MLNGDGNRVSLEGKIRTFAIRVAVEHLLLAEIEVGAILHEEAALQLSHSRKGPAATWMQNVRALWLQADHRPQTTLSLHPGIKSPQSPVPAKVR